MEPLTLQAYLEDKWQDIAQLAFADDYSVQQLTYLADPYRLLQDNHYAVSLNLPVSLFPIQARNGWFAFLDDMIPAGASRRYWLEKLDIRHLPLAEQNYRLLKQGAIAPIGHLRIKQAVSSVPPLANERYFSLREVKDRHSDFLDYANQRGAMAGGATGAGGEAPKLLLRQTQDNRIWIDNQQTHEQQDDYYLVKFPRGHRSPIDCDILRAEFYYYHELASLGFQTINTQKIRLEEGERYPSLWLPRFDIEKNAQGKWQRYAMESVYSMLEKGAGALLEHHNVLEKLIEKIQSSFLVQSGFTFNVSQFVCEWVKRDLLNIAFGNSDNHGRNTAFLRDEHRIWLAPIYDFAPMKADPEGIPRSTIWQNAELGGEYRFDLIAESLAAYCSPDELLRELRTLAAQLVNLKQRLNERGVPSSILDFPAIGFDYLPEKLQRWHLI